VIPAELVGLWDSGPYDYGAMESSSVALLADGSGWSTWANSGGVMSVRRFTWSCPAPGMLRLAYTTEITGPWEPGGLVLAAVDEQEPDDTVVLTAYTIGSDVTPLAAEPFTALRLAEPVEYVRAYALLRRDVTDADDPARSVVDRA